MKELIKFQYWVEKNFLTKTTRILTQYLDVTPFQKCKLLCVSFYCSSNEHGSLHEIFNKNVGAYTPLFLAFE